ncbi:MAG: CarD family transcriptional regulator [Caldilineaceae bacterium]
MEYAIGQTLVHPAHGVGKIINVEKIRLDESPQEYYVLRFADKQLTVRVPFKRADIVGLRQIMTKEKVKQVLSTLRAEPQVLPKDHKKRQKLLETLVYSGYPIKVAEAVRELTWRRRTKKHLGIEDQRLLDHGRGLLVQELGLAMKHDDGETLEVIDQALDEACQQVD